MDKTALYTRVFQKALAGRLEKYAANIGMYGAIGQKPGQDQLQPYPGPNPIPYKKKRVRPVSAINGKKNSKGWDENSQWAQRKKLLQ